MTLHEWAQRWQISQECMRELIQTAVPVSDNDSASGSESRVQSLVRIDAAKHSVHLFRNNVGAGKAIDDTELCPQCQTRGRFIRWGLANDSKNVNSVVKSGDLIGWQPVVVTAVHVGTTIARFVSRECKDASWKWHGTPRELAQLNWANLVNAHGGDAKFTTGSF